MPMQALGLIAIVLVSVAMHIGRVEPFAPNIVLVFPLRIHENIVEKLTEDADSSEEYTRKFLLSIWSCVAPADVFSNRTIAEMIEQGFVGSVIAYASHEVRDVEQFSDLG
jgi:hypothetical protein